MASVPSTSLIAPGGLLRFSIDRGGTFTDVVAEFPTHPDLVAEKGSISYKIMKLLSVNPGSYPDAPREAIRRLLQEFTGEVYPIDEPIRSDRIESVRMGTTVATNALLERRGEPCVLVTTAGHEDLLSIGNQARPQIFDIRVRRPPPIVEATVPAYERVFVDTLGLSTPAGAEGDSAEFLGKTVPVSAGTTGERVLVLETLDEEKLRAALAPYRAKGIASVAVALAHSYTFQAHEQRVAAVCRELGFTHVSLSSEVMSAVKLVPRAFTAAADAYLTPCVQQYLSQFLGGFDAAFRARRALLFMQSDGGLTDAGAFTGVRAVLSGPAGGVVGFSRTSFRGAPRGDADGDAEGKDGDDDDDAEEADANKPSATTVPSTRRPLIGFDMGGTSTDVSRFSGRFEHIFENTTAGVTIQAPQLDINTVAAGGGSILTFTAGMFNVGPESASAHPGPACYRRGGPLTVTDANLLVGRINPAHFPKVFGPNQDQPLDAEATKARFAEMTETINKYLAEKSEGNATPLTPHDVALGFLAVANESMCRPIRALTEARGFDLASHTLACFGAAGGQHACAVAAALGISAVHVHRFSGVLSAYGIGLADVVEEAQAPANKALRTRAGLADVTVGSDALAAQAEAALKARGAAVGAGSGEGGRIRAEFFIGLRYEGTDTAVMVRVPASVRARVAEILAASPVSSEENSAEDAAVSAAAELLEAAFLKQYRREFGFVLARSVLLDTVRVRVIAAHDAVVAAIEDSDDEASDDDDEDDDDKGGVQKRVAAAGASLAAADRKAHGFPRASLPLPEPISHALCYFPQSTLGAITSLATLGSADAADETARTEPPNALPLPDAGVQGGFVHAPVYKLGDLTVGSQVEGPAVIVDETATVCVDPAWRARIGHDGIVIKTVSAASTCPVAAADAAAEAAAAAAAAVPVSSAAEAQERFPCDPIRLSVFAHRFMSVAEQMGRALQRTSVSTNIKERLDFSCALFGPDGGLVANAPHLPVHLGAMQEAVRAQVKLLGGQWKDGDVVMSNHPQAGGSHLPDITVITPVFAHPTDPTTSFFVASRGHHADIGGITPGSMPPFSKYLSQEGAAVMSLHLVEAGGPFRTDAVAEALAAPGKQPKRTPDEPASVGTRNLADNLSDLAAQVAANHKGVQLMRGLVGIYGLPTVQAYMHHIQSAAEEAVRDMLRSFVATNPPPKTSKKTTTGWVRYPRVIDQMDDGTVIALSLSIDPVRGEAIFDFTGTSPQVYGNTNAPRAVAYSAVIYCLRCMVRRNIPLNQGCLNPVQVTIPLGTLLNPTPEAAVVGGNVLTSQRVTDVVFRAFAACAASQGCMNNLTFGDDTFGYYETIAGGAGAGPTWVGTSGIHTHMTNTRMTDVEIVERRYPVLVRRFALRRGSGGVGAFAGGDGVVRDLCFLKPLSVNILSERRVLRPWGAAGGGDARAGRNLVLRGSGWALPAPAAEYDEDAEDAAEAEAAAEEAEAAAAAGAEAEARVVSLGGKNTYYVEAGDVVRIMTPGGGAWGPATAAATAAAAAAAAEEEDGGEALTMGSVAQYQQMQESA